MSKKLNNASLRNKALVIAASVVALASIAYAAFSTTLTINGTGNISGDWDVHINSITQTSGTGVTDHNSVAAAVQTGDLSANFNVDMAYPGATATYEVVIQNHGSISAKVTGLPSLTTINAADPADVKFTVSGITLNQVLNPGDTATATVTVTWESVTTQSNPSVLSKTAEITYTVEQNL